MNLLSIFDRPIAFHRPLVTITGSITAALMLSQAIYWSRRTTEDDGWFYKTMAEWEEETGMTRREQETARAKLRELGFIEEERRGMPAQLHYRVNEEAILDALVEHGIMSADCTKAPNKTARIRQTVYIEQRLRQRLRQRLQERGRAKKRRLPPTPPIPSRCASRPPLRLLQNRKRNATNPRSGSGST